MGSADLGPEGVQEVLLRPRLPGKLLLLVGSALFTAGGIWMIHEQKSSGWFVAIIFGIFTAVAGVQLFPGSDFLRLTPDGFTMKAMFRTTSTRWKDVSGFGVVKMQQHGFLTVNTMVGFDYVDSYDRSRIGRNLARAMTGCEAALPNLYGLRAEELASLMNSWREYHAGARSPA